MVNSKNTKRSLLISILSMMLCLAMLIGSTFAWFSDSVVSGANKIVAGNLDVELEYSSDPTNEDSWKKVEADTNLFKPADETLWEPGHTEYVYLRVRNAGSLALKYNFSVNVYGDANGGKEQIYTSKDDGRFYLSKKLVFSKKDGTDPINDRKDLWIKDGEEEKNAMGKLDGLAMSEVLLPNEKKAMTLAVYMPTQVGNEANQMTSNRVVKGAPTIYLGLTLSATQTPHENDSFDETYDANVEIPKITNSRSEFNTAVSKGGNVVLNKDIKLSYATTVYKDTTIDLNGHKIIGGTNKHALDFRNAKVTVKNDTIEATPGDTGSALFAEGTSNVTIENCTIKSNTNRGFTVSTNGATSLDTRIHIKDSEILAPNTASAKGYALYAPAGNITFENCDVTGHVFISGGNITLDGGTYTATGFSGQNAIWHKDDTVSYVVPKAGGAAYNMGDSILISDRRDGYTLSGLTIRNITFNTELTLKDGSKANAYAIKYVDLNANGATNPVDYVIENNTYNQKIDGADPVMFIDRDGNDISK